MRTPGFTAEQSLGRTGRVYRTVDRAGGFRGTNLLPQQDDWDAEGGGVGTEATCCRKKCPGACHCSGHQGHCDSVVEEAQPEFLMAGPIDKCVSTDGRSHAYCSCGCWADAHDAGCGECPELPEPIYL
ncbi:hypothetical protein [Nocardia sp. CS682]|uniref:hypothetical protein n=1 Tax=Nocardia sp. CS682 TaxID=1047172 RepID=UPI00107520EF|nr:hypothetical protein [Nocardia sp. CS682]